MTEKKFDFWREHSLRYLEMAHMTNKCEVIANPDGYGKHTADCGDTIEFFLVVENDFIRNVSFKIEGCLNTLAAANTIVRLTEGKSADAAWDIGSEEILEYLESMPEESEHCAELATEALRRALMDFRNKKKSPWKKLYGVR